MAEIAFVSMPFGSDPEDPSNEWTKLYDHGLKPLQKKIKGRKAYEPVILKRADRNLTDLGLKNNVKALIQDATFVIGVLTTTAISTDDGDIRLTNPNVLWELGHAEALGKPIVILADNKSVKELPVLAGVPNVCIYNHDVVRSVSAKDAPDALRGIANDLVDFINAGVRDARSGQAKGRTHARTYVDRAHIDLGRLIESATRQVDILTTNVGWFVNHLTVSEDTKKHPFAEAIGNGVPIRIVTMDSESLIAEYRARQLNKGDNIPDYRQELRKGIVDLFRMFGEDDNFHLHIYNDLPVQITVRVDHRIFTSIVTTGERARKRLQIEFSEFDEGVTDSFITHFESMFVQSQDVRGVAWVLREPKTD